jgi:phi13 family phage major tail protein
MANKVKFGLKNVYYALATIAANGSATYETPKAFPGAVSLSLDVQGDLTPFRADNMDYYVSNGQNSYQGDLEMALFTDEVRQDLFGDVKEETSGLQYEVAGQEAKHFALMFQFEGDVHATRHVLYNCTATRPSVGSTTTGENGEIEPQTETSTITSSPIYIPSIQKEVVKAKAVPQTSEARVSTGHKVTKRVIYRRSV